MGPEIYKRINSILGGNKCFKCTFDLILDLSSHQTPLIWNGIFLTITFLETAACPLDVMMEKVTQFVGKEIKVQQEENASVVFIVSLRKPFLNLLNFNYTYFYSKVTRLCSAVFGISKETYCPEIDIYLHEIVHLQTQNLKRNFRSFFNGPEPVENGTRTVCLETYFSIMALHGGYQQLEHSVYSCIIIVVIFRLGILLMIDVHIWGNLVPTL